MMKKIILALVAIGIIGGAYYVISPFFIHTKADEALPTLSPLTTTQTPPSVSTPPSKALSAPLIGTKGHPVSGSVRIVSDGTDTYVRYENFKTINGPDIYVYLAKDLEAKEYISLGRVKATEGNVNYVVPTGVTTSDYQYVLIWCKAFGVLFNYADISNL